MPPVQQLYHPTGRHTRNAVVSNAAEQAVPASAGLILFVDAPQLLSWSQVMESRRLSSYRTRPRRERPARIV